MGIISLAFPKYTYAHAFGTLYTLPIPLWLYLWGAAAALIVSFLAAGFFTRESSKFFFPKINFRLNPWIVLFLQALSLILFLITILVGLFGSQFSYENFAVNFFWIIFLLGFSYLSAVFGNIWEIVNPWKIIISWFGELKPIVAYPKKFIFIPALISYFLLIWLELLSGGLGVQPGSLSTILLLYSFITFSGVFIFGKNWFEYGEFFSVFFGLISKLSPFSKKGSLTEDKPKSFNLLIFILFMLSSTAFDGFRSTSTWLKIYFNIISPFEKILGDNAFQIIQIVILILSPIFFLTLYSLAIGTMKILSKTSISFKNLSLHFAFSLIPIAIAYNVAHYYTLLLTQGQAIIPQISDPFNQGWNLFGTSDYQTNVGILGANFIWHSEVAVIIIGHIFAVFLAHIMALKLFTRRQAFVSQIPMLFLMVLYTVTGLWILSQPLTVGG